MPHLAILAVLLVFAATPPAAAYNEPSYNFKGAPKGQATDATDKEKAEAAEEAKKEEAKTEEEELTPQQIADRERRQITGEGSDVARGDEHKWPHIGRKR
jgi:hypothetical protein